MRNFGKYVILQQMGNTIIDRKKYYGRYREHERKYYLEHREHHRKIQLEYRERNRQLNLNGGIDDKRQLKKCTICKEYLPLSCFTKDVVKWDGLNAFCRQCNKIKAGQWRERNRQRANELIYRSNAKYPDRIKARGKANWRYPEAQLCIIKDCNELGERHHRNYGNGLDIIWLCRKHHNWLYHSK